MNKGIEDLNNTVSTTPLAFKKNILSNAIGTFNSKAHGTISKKDYILSHRTNFKKFKRMKLIEYILLLYQNEVRKQ
jgi:hypothetical protein